MAAWENVDEDKLMILPKGILRSMQLGAATLAVGFAGCGEPIPPAVDSQRPGTTAPEKVAPLTEAQLKTFEQALPKLTSKSGDESGKAWHTILALGRGAIVPLQAAAAKNKDDAALRAYIQRLITWINAGGDPCPPCGRG